MGKKDSSLLKDIGWGVAEVAWLAGEYVYDKFVYDSDGYDRNGFHEYYKVHKITNTEFDENGFNKRGIHQSTNTKFDKNGYDKNGFNKKGIHQLTNTKWDKLGFNSYGFNIHGIHKITDNCQVQSKNAPECSAKVHHLVTPIC